MYNLHLPQVKPNVLMKLLILCTWFTSLLEILKWMCSPLLDFSACAEGMFFFVEVMTTNDSAFPPCRVSFFPFALMGM